MSEKTKKLKSQKRGRNEETLQATTRDQIEEETPVTAGDKSKVTAKDNREEPLKTTRPIVMGCPRIANSLPICVTANLKCGECGHETYKIFHPIQKTPDKFTHVVEVQSGIFDFSKGTWTPTYVFNTKDSRCSNCNALFV